MDTDKNCLTVGVYLRRLRKGRAITQTDLAARLGWSQRRISELENGSDPRLSELQALAEVLECSPKTLASLPVSA